ncbi:uncharacterized protein LOC119767907 [Culex quinquefasciatus]|uniref:uncharacterized protein LOC119767907 n=1 Tax=Culex quinquefasciatus TaxID=7176 RepID=UPI0018E35DEA|nr:uncharacterized protein LOC119767907 [Culex quinquefasciatus]
MPRVNKQRRAAILRESKKKIAKQIESLPDPLAWTITNPWNARKEHINMSACLRQSGDSNPSQMTNENEEHTIDQLRHSPALCFSPPDIQEPGLNVRGSVSESSTVDEGFPTDCQFILRKSRCRNVPRTTTATSLQHLQPI